MCRLINIGSYDGRPVFTTPKNVKSHKAALDVGMKPSNLLVAENREHNWDKAYVHSDVISMERLMDSIQNGNIQRNDCGESFLLKLNKQRAEYFVPYKSFLKQHQESNIDELV